MSIAAIPNPTAIHRCAKHPDKVQHRTSQDAFDARDRAQARTEHPLYVYVCDHCGYFHLTKKRGTENIGRQVTSVKDGLLWQSRGQQPPEPPERDLRFIPSTTAGKTDAAIIDAIRAHGNPDEVRPAEIMHWVGISAATTRRAMTRLGWLPTGATKAARWVRPGTAPSSPESPSAAVTLLKQPDTTPAPPTAPVAAPRPAPRPVRSLPAPEVKVISPKAVASLTVEDLMTGWAAVGYALEIRAVPVPATARARR